MGQGNLSGNKAFQDFMNPLKSSIIFSIQSFLLINKIIAIILITGV